MAARSVGVATGVLPLLHLTTPTGASAPQLDAQLRDLLRAYHRGTCITVSPGNTLVAGIECDVDDCFIAIVDHNGSTSLVCGTGRQSEVEEGLARVVALLQAIGEQDKLGKLRGCSPHSADVAAAMAALQRWSASRYAHASAGLHTAAYARARRRLIRRIDTISLRTPAHLRPRIHELAATARRVATNAYGSGAEHVLAELADAAMTDEAWLRAVECFGQLQRLGSASVDEVQIRLLGVLILRRDSHFKDRAEKL